MNRPLDDIAPAIRAACERWPDAANLQQHYRDLARAWEEEGSSVIELTKSFLECVCWTVLNELSAPKPDTSTPTTSELLSCVLDALGLRNQRGVGPLGKVISGHNKLAEGLNELRNQDGSVAHGRDGFLDAISTRHARVYLLSADAVVALILSAYDGKEPNLRTTREPPERFRHLNERIDAGCALDAEVDLEDGVLVIRVQAGAQTPEEAIELRVPPSELLYQLDRQAYVSVLEALGGIAPADETEEEAEAFEPVAEVEREPVEDGEEGTPTAAPEPAPEPVKQQLLDDYRGRFREKVHPLYEFVVHQLLEGSDDQAERVRRFVNTLLAEMEHLAVVDWARREPERAAVRVALKRLIRLAAIDGLDNKAVEPLLDWLGRQIENGNEP
jgi:hypothetical protein